MEEQRLLTTGGMMKLIIADLFCMPTTGTNSYNPRSSTETGTVILILQIRKLRLREVGLSKVSELEGVKPGFGPQSAAGVFILNLSAI